MASKVTHDDVIYANYPYFFPSYETIESITEEDMISARAVLDKLRASSDSCPRWKPNMTMEENAAYVQFKEEVRISIKKGTDAFMDALLRENLNSRTWLVGRRMSGKVNVTKDGVTKMEACDKKRKRDEDGVDDDFEDQ